jgi:hypothetical protein
MNDSQKLVKLAMAARRVIESHNKAASELEPGFTCGCSTVCQPLIEALGGQRESGAKSRRRNCCSADGGAGHFGTCVR